MYGTNDSTTPTDGYQFIAKSKDLSPYNLEDKHPRVESVMGADIWVVPRIVIETVPDRVLT